MSGRGVAENFYRLRIRNRAGKETKEEKKDYLSILHLHKERQQIRAAREGGRQREKGRETDGSGRGRDGERVTYGGESRFVPCTAPRRAAPRVGSIVLLREVDRSLSLSHAALIAHRSLIYRAGERTGERGIR